jgi:hypothetical protein
MTDIRIEWLYDSTDCDQAGCSGGYAEGAKVYFDDKLTLDLSPAASCFGGVDYDKEDIFARILSKLGHKLVEVTYD